MATRRFQVLSEGLRMQAVVDTPETGSSWPLVICNHPASRPKDGVFFDPLVPMLTGRGIAVCRYDPRGYGASEGAASSITFWTRWMDLTAVTLYTNDEMEYVFPKVGLAGLGIGAVLSFWWAAVHAIDAVVAFSLPAPKKLGPIPRAMQNLLPHDLPEDANIPHPSGVANGLLLLGEKDKGAENAAAFERELSLKTEIVAGADKAFTQVKPRNEAFERAADWFARHLLAESPAHRRETETEAPGEAGARLTEEPAQE